MSAQKALPNATKGQFRVLDAIKKHLETHDYSPTVRELCELTGLTSTATVQVHLTGLEKAGYISRPSGKSRSIELLCDPGSGARAPVGDAQMVPLVGFVGAGTGVLAEENIEEILSIPKELAPTGELFVLKVRGDSMCEAAILHGDLVVVRSQPDAEIGDIVVASIGDEEATVKHLAKKGAEVILEPANSELEPIHLHGSEVAIYGKVVSVMRRI